jgi:predicted O-linked N-acetylglucosamine transferase (SPINDLY family)
MAAKAIRRHERIRVGYVCADFRSHAISYLVVELFELHDRTRFETIGISIGPDDGSDFRQRLVRAFDQFHDVPARSDHDVARLMSELEIDIAIDLMGYTRNDRCGIFVHRPAPIQVNYLGYPGTVGTDDVFDYVIGDPTVLPFDLQPFFAERIVQLPGCYQVNDSQRAIAAETPTRGEAGLPERGFVFCCFNGSYKITSEIFDVWMRLLHAVEGSVLWLLRSNAADNLRRAAAGRGIDPTRLVFADPIEPSRHLARHRLADLFLDTLPYNAHTTASDALRVGLPMVTCRGKAFAGRVAASLLHTVGLDELVTDSLAEYEALALRLAGDRQMLVGLARKLEQGRSTCALFATDRTCRQIEAAYTRMWELAQNGKRPCSFLVKHAPDPRRAVDARL